MTEISLDDLPRGLYLVEESSSGLFDHSFILDIGNTSGQFSEAEYHDRQGQPKPSILHMAREIGLCGITAEEYAEQGGSWEILGQISNIQAAVQRIIDYANQNGPYYEWLTNNCEHFANYVATGEKKSPQLRGWATTAFVGAMIVGSMFKKDE